MKARIVLIVDLGDPAKWRMRKSISSGRLGWMPDRRPLAEILDDRLCDAVQGVEEYAGGVIEATIEPIADDTPTTGVLKWTTTV
jgi:transposase